MRDVARRANESHRMTYYGEYGVSREMSAVNDMLGMRIGIALTRGSRISTNAPHQTFNIQRSNERTLKKKHIFARDRHCWLKLMFFLYWTSRNCSGGSYFSGFTRVIQIINAAKLYLTHSIFSSFVSRLRCYLNVSPRRRDAS